MIKKSILRTISNLTLANKKLFLKTPLIIIFIQHKKGENFYFAIFQSCIVGFLYSNPSFLYFET